MRQFNQNINEIKRYNLPISGVIMMPSKEIKQTELLINTDMSSCNYSVIHL